MRGRGPSQPAVVRATAGLVLVPGSAQRMPGGQAWASHTLQPAELSPGQHEKLLIIKRLMNLLSIYFLNQFGLFQHID